MVLGSMVDSVAASAATFYYSPKTTAFGGGDVFSEDYGQPVKCSMAQLPDGSIFWNCGIAGNKNCLVI